MNVLHLQKKIKNPMLKECCLQIYDDFIENIDNHNHNGNSAELLGHSYEGCHIVETYLSKYKMDIQFKNQVLHMIGSRMNEYSEWGELVMSKMLEVIIINFADNIDSHLEPAYSYINQVEKGHKYKIANALRDYYKSLNPYYNVER